MPKKQEIHSLQEPFITGRKIHNFAKLPRVIKMLVSEIY